MPADDETDVKWWEIAGVALCCAAFLTVAGHICRSRVLGGTT